MLDLDRWPIFSLLTPELKSRIRQACVFGSAGNEAIYVTTNDDVYALGSNCSGCLGLGDSTSRMEPVKVEQLCKKRVVMMAYGTGPHVVVVTAAGEMYSWGHNGYCQLGNGSSNQGPVPSIITTNMIGRKIRTVACGGHHSVALSSDGEVFAWGQNNCGQVGNGSTTNQPTPRKVQACIGHRVTASIACGQTSTLVTLDNGDVFGWGYNGNGQLGLGNNVNQPNPCRISGLQGHFITQIACGYAHSLARSDEGDLFAWGANSYGQLGTGNKANMVAPVAVARDNGRFVEIAASHYNHISAGVTQAGKVLMWGQCRSQSVTSPTETLFDSLHDVFAAYASPSVTWKPLNIEDTSYVKVAQSIELAFDDPTNSDLKFSLEGKTIYVHKSVLKIRCDYFRSMFQSHWDENGKDVIEIVHYSYNVYRAFLNYLYTDKLDLTPEEAIGLLDLANAYCETQLKRVCERVIRHGITVQNAAMLYAAAVKYEAKDLEDFCFRFAMNHMTSVIQSDAFSSLDESVMKDMIIRAAESGAFKY